MEPKWSATRSFSGPWPGADFPGRGQAVTSRTSNVGAFVSLASKVEREHLASSWPVPFLRLSFFIPAGIEGGKLEISTMTAL